MRVIISNDKKRLYGRIDYNLLEKTKISQKTLESATVLPVINPSGFSNDDFICINDPGKERSEIRQISSISDKNITISSATTFEFESKTNIYRMEYDAIKFYENDTVINTISIKPDYLVSIPATVSNSIAYSMSFFNTQNSKETEKGEAVYSTDNLICSESDVFKYEDLEILGPKIIDKIDISSRDIRNIFRGQKQNIKDVDHPDLLRSACALSALRYIFLEISKNQGDTASAKAMQYGEMYDSEIRKITEIINIEDDNVRVFGQTRSIR